MRIFLYVSVCRGDGVLKGGPGDELVASINPCGDLAVDSVLVHIYGHLQCDLANDSRGRGVCRHGRDAVHDPNVLVRALPYTNDRHPRRCRN